jgi:hypothetical protein
MRQAYHLGLAQLDRDSAQMCTAAGKCLRDATEALPGGDADHQDQGSDETGVLAETGVGDVSARRTR